MNNYDSLVELIRSKKSFLCIGLDPDLDRLPAHLSKDISGVAEFCESIIEATHHLAVCYKINLAFFEALGLGGFDCFLRVASAIPEDCLLMADAKRGDIGNSSRMYAKAFFDRAGCDALTVAPYMGSDSVSAFLEYKDKWTVLLALTSNQGSRDFQMQDLIGGGKLYERVLNESSTWADKDQLMYVVGATHPEQLSQIRDIIPDHFLLVPGVGAQGGTVAGVCEHGLARNGKIGLLINSSRSIIYASEGHDYAEASAKKALDLQSQMQVYL